MSPNQTAADSPGAAPSLPPTVDPVVFCRKQQVVDGSSPLAGFERLVAADVAPEGDIDWSVAGAVGRDEAGRLREFLDVELTFAPVMTCSRCLGPIRIGPLSIRRRFRLAASERQADLEDRESESVEVIATDPRLSLADLVEDESILSLPMAPAHSDCEPPAGRVPPDAAT